MHGAYPLPEAQLDRFAMKLRIGYPNRNDEMQMLASNIGEVDAFSADDEPILDPSQLRELQRHVAGVTVSNPCVNTWLTLLPRLVLTLISHSG